MGTRGAVLGELADLVAGWAVPDPVDDVEVRINATLVAVAARIRGLAEAEGPADASRADVMNEVANVLALDALRRPEGHRTMWVVGGQLRRMAAGGEAE